MSETKNQSSGTEKICRNCFYAGYDAMRKNIPGNDIWCFIDDGCKNVSTHDTCEKWKHYKEKL